jgi:ADP-dependent NAD(P)H-hydrate dehydratase / NAD(P)H-hydrate epimerase
MNESTPFRDLLAGTLPARLPARQPDCHKGDFGAVGVLGGAPGMAGAAFLASRAALLAGAGRVYVGVLDERIAWDPTMPELMVAAPARVLELPAPACLVAGPGLGQSGAARDWLVQALAVPHALVLDADALNLLAADPALADRLRQRPHPSLLTPHPGEAARLLGLSTQQVQAQRPEALQALARRYGASVVLKGHGSLVQSRDGSLWRNTSGNPGMAAPGMGDVLAGLIAALAAQGLSLDDAALVGVWLHGRAADQLVAKGTGPAGLTASEVITAVRGLVNGA